MADLVGSSVRVSAPATSANLGPGFDAFGLALDRRDVVDVEVAPSGVVVDVSGQGAQQVPRNESHLVVKAIRATFELLGVAQPGLRLTCRNAIPQGRGLGSSAAAIVSGILAADALAGGVLSPEETLALATRIEGHADNVAACLMGGFTIAWQEAGRARALRQEVSAEVRPTVFIAPDVVATTVARGLLPASISHSAASANAARAALLVAALSNEPTLLLAATHDELHQQFRRPAMPDSLVLMDALRAGGVPAVISGAGPSVLAFGTRQQPVDVRRWTPPRWVAAELAVDSGGAQARSPHASKSQRQ